MKMLLFPMRTPFIFPLVVPSLIYTKEIPNTVYLTFDDGPEITTTPWLLKFLKEENIKAVFFCIGKNIKALPDLTRQIVSEGHILANHSYAHHNGWKTDDETYIESIEETDTLIQSFSESQKIFRPPYGRIKPAQIKKIQKLDYKIVIWSVMGGDFSKNLDVNHAIEYLSNKIRSGDIIVLHDSIKAFDNLKKILPPVVTNLKAKGFEFGIL